SASKRIRHEETVASAASGGHFKKPSRALNPFLSVAHGAIVQMRYCDSRPNRCVVGSIEFQQLLGRSISALLAIRRKNQRARCRGSKPITLQPQKHQFGYGIDDSKVPAELETVDDHRLVFQTNVLRP